MNDAMRTRCGRSRSSAKRKACQDPRPAKKRHFGLSFAFLSIVWSLFVLLNSCITDSEDELRRLTAEENSLAFDDRHGLIYENPQCHLNNVGVLRDTCKEHEVDQNSHESPSVQFNEENAICEETFVEETSISGTYKHPEEIPFENPSFPGVNSIGVVCNLGITQPNSGGHNRQENLELVTSDENLNKLFGQGETSQNSHEESSVLDLQKKVGWLLRVEERSGSANYFVVGQPESSRCDFANSKGEPISQRCLIASPTESVKNHDFISYNVDINRVCGAQREFSESDIGSQDTCAICYRDSSLGTTSCESICLSSSRSWLESRRSFCVCGCSIIESFEGASVNLPEIGSIVTEAASSADSGQEIHVKHIQNSAAADLDCDNAQGSEMGAALSSSSNDSFAGDLLETPAIVVPNDEHDVGGQSLEVIEPTRPIRVPPIGLDEYKRKAILEIQQVLSSKSNAARLEVRHRLEPGGGAYNYAAATHGAKVMASNKEAKGASNILEKDKDKYMRNPCSAEKKFVIVELSEETLVDTVAIANYEFSSSNLKDLELLGSLSFPTDDWVLLGKFEAENARHLLSFKLNEPKWVRYLRLDMLSHHGSEFFCTLSTLEVFGEDALERLMEDWRGEEEETRFRVRSTSTTLIADEKPGGGTLTGENVPLEYEPSSSVAKESNHDSNSGEHIRQPSSGMEAAATLVGSSTSLKDKADSLDDGGKSSTPENVASVRPPGDSILKIIMQKVKSLELNQSLFDRYLEDMNLKYSDMFTDLDQELSVLSEHLRNQMLSLVNLTKRLHELNVTLEFKKRMLESAFAVQSETFRSELEILRLRIHRAETRELLALTLALLIMTISGLLYSVYRCLFLVGLKSWKNDQTSYVGAFMGLFVVSGLIPLILSV